MTKKRKNESDCQLNNNVAELIMQKERYMQAIESSRVGLWDWNLKNNSIYFSRHWKEMLGYEEQEIANDFSSWQERVHPEDLAQALQDVQDNINKKTHFYHNIHRLRHKNGSWVWIDDRGKTFYDSEGNATRMIGTHIDITKLKESEAYNFLHAKRAEVLLSLPQLNETLSESDFLQKAMEFCENLTSSVISFIHFVNDDEKTIEFIAWSHQTLRNYCNAVFDRHYSADQAGIWAEALRQRKALIFNDYKNAKNKKGLPEGHVHLERFISLPVIEDGKVVMLCGVGNKTSDYDSTELESLQLIANETWRLVQRRRNQAKLNEAKEMLLVQSRHAAMGEMMSMLAHQWRQPISIIEMCINNILLDLELDELSMQDLKTQLLDITKQTHYLSATIDDFRNFFKPDKHKKSITLDNLLQSAFTLMGKSFEVHGIEIIFDNSQDIATYAYPKELLQVFINIFTNAKEALMEKQPLKPYIMVQIAEDRNEISIKFTDNAGGIDAEILDKVFDPYFSTKNYKDGTGLGLYMNKIIMEKHLGGTILASNAKEGACIELILPKKLHQATFEI
ncbi:MAG: PAS domain-containing protein [Sulfurospirillum sp.]|nr:PAS domain-containing protein [Sulfurospirillum sp.]